MMRTTMAIVFTTLGLSATGAAAQGAPAAVSLACRSEVMALCPKGDDKAARRACMMEKRASLSETCRGELRAAMMARRAARGVPGNVAPTPADSTPTPPS